MNSCRIVILSDNTVQKMNLLAEHGWSCWVEFGDRRLLFDVGQGGVLLHNAYRLGVRLDHARDVVLSHGHYDHVDGLPNAIRGAHPVRVWMHADAVKPKYRSRNGKSRYIGMSPAARQALEKPTSISRWVEKPVEIVSGLFATGPIPRTTSFESPGAGFYRDEAALTTDPILDDQAIFFRSAQGLVILLGCAHAGVVNTIRYVREIAGDQPIHAIIGGTHLVDAKEHRITETINALRDENVEMIAPAHCTGYPAMHQLSNAFGGLCRPCYVGREFHFALP